MTRRSAGTKPAPAKDATKGAEAPTPKAEAPAIDATATEKVEPAAEAATPAVEEATALAAPDTTTRALTSTKFGSRAGAGMETIDTSLIKISYWLLVGSQTPGASKKGDPVYQQVGNFYDPLSGRVFDGENGLAVVALAMHKTYVERTDDADRKFKGILKPNDPRVLAGIRRTEAENRAKPETHRFGKVVAPEVDASPKTHFIETHNVLCVMTPVDKDGKVIDPTDLIRGVISIKSTGIPTLKKWASGVSDNCYMGGIKLQKGEIPIFANIARLVALPRSRGEQSWHVPCLTPFNKDVRSSVTDGTDGPCPFLYVEACDTVDALAAKKMVIDESGADAATGGAEGGGGGADGDMDW